MTQSNTTKPNLSNEKQEFEKRSKVEKILHKIVNTVRKKLSQKEKEVTKNAFQPPP
jgi:preprotein translocase subunit SecA